MSSSSSSAAVIVEGDTHIDGIPIDLCCISCKEVLVDAVLFSCGHSLCQECHQTLINKRCPTCSQAIRSTVPNYTVRSFLRTHYPDACKKAINGRDDGWTITHCAADWASNGTKRKLISYLAAQSRGTSSSASVVPPAAKVAKPNNPAASASSSAAPAGLVFPPLRADTVPGWNGYVQVPGPSGKVVDVRLPGMEAHVLKVVMQKDDRVFMAFGKPLKQGDFDHSDDDDSDEDHD